MHHRIVYRAALLVSASLALHCTAWAYDQAQAVRKRFPDPPVSFATPAFATGKTNFTSHEEMTAFVTALDKRNVNVQVKIIGRSQEGRAIPLLLISSARIASPADALRLGRPIVWLQGLQHGDEPAGGEAMLALAQALAEGELRELTEKLTILIVPRVNPDGAQHVTRQTARGIDINRDHVKFDLPETVALHQAANDYQPELFVDAHEFAVAQRWMEKFGGLTAPDLTLIYATNPNVPPAITKLAEDPFHSAVVNALEHEGYRSDWYFTTSHDPKDKKVVRGGVTPDIARNTYGLSNAVSFLLESRGVGIGRDAYLRRVTTLYIAASAILRAAAENAERLQRTTAEARAAVAQAVSAHDPIVVASRSPLEKTQFRLIDPLSGSDKIIDVSYENSLVSTPILVRARPYAYLLPRTRGELAQKLMLNGVQVRQLVESAALEVEAFEVIDKNVSSELYEGHYRTQVKTEINRRRITFASGTYVVFMAQPNANLAALALEPESPSSFVSFSILPVERRGLTNGVGSEIPIYRLLTPANLASVIMDPDVR
jgi:hypothetical protein